MKEIKNIKAIAIIALLIIASIVTIAINPFKFNTNYSKNVRMEIDLEKEFNISDILAIANSIYTEETPIIRKAGAFEKTVSITVRDFTEEQNEKLINKLNEKYETELTAGDINIYYNSNVKGKDLIKPYIVPVIIAGIFILVFFGIRYRKIGLAKSVGGPIVIICATQLLYAFLINIFGMQINEATVIVSVTIGIFSLMYLTATYEKMINKE